MLNIAVLANTKQCAVDTMFEFFRNKCFDVFPLCRYEDSFGNVFKIVLNKKDLCGKDFDQVILCNDIVRHGFTNSATTMLFGKITQSLMHSDVPEEFQIIRLEE